MTALLHTPQGTYALVYDFNTPNETFEWVDLNKVRTGSRPGAPDDATWSHTFWGADAP